MSRVPLAFTIGLVLAGPAIAAEEQSVLVRTLQPREDSLHDIVTAYGTAGPALDSSMTISRQSPGRITRFLVTAGEAVEAGQPLLDFAVSQSALGNYRQAETALATAKIDRTRVQQLVGQQLATKDQLTQADKAIADAQTSLDTLRRSGADKADVVIDAPFSGVVTTIPVAQGDTIAQGAPMMTLMRADGLVVSVGIEPSQRLRVKRGAPVRLDPLTSGGAGADGTISRIDGLLNARTHLVDADVATKAALLPGAAFRASITVGRFTGIVVPRDAVLTDATGTHLFQVEDGKAHRVAVTILGSAGLQSVVSGPIQPSEPIVVQGDYQLTDGMAVRVDTMAPPSTIDTSRQ